jgi:alkanesulfonate monooxygenase SsuD/methylene tetrahydromethanopterin reductase-like flavin-dependent oxidoreductase (luciferase family)
MFTMRFDMRAPETGAPIRELYDAAIEMAAWGEAHDCMSIQISEHHAASDGYLPAPFLLAAAMAARTQTLPMQIAALLVPLHDPVALAEQMAILDIMSGGRVTFVLAVGFRREEFEMFGQSFEGRGRHIEECIDVMRRAWTAEPFEWQGRRIQVTPRPLTPGGPPLLMGGKHPAVIRRAARLGMGMLTPGGDAALEELYREACAEAGTEPGLFLNPVGTTVNSGFVAEDPDRAWREMGPHLLHDANMYAEWLGGLTTATKSHAASVEDLRAEKGSYQIFTPDEAIAHIREHGLLATQPLCGGLPPKLAWESLELLASKVLPRLRET